MNNFTLPLSATYSGPHGAMVLAHVGGRSEIGVMKSGVQVVLTTQNYDV